MDLHQYTQYNNSFGEKYIYRLGGSVGFFSEYNNMLIAMLWCAINKKQFVLESEDANFSTGLGWNEFFVPFVTEFKNSLVKKYNFRIKPTYSNKTDRLLFNLRKKIFPRQHYMFEFFEQTRQIDPTITYYIPELELSGTVLTCCSEFHKMVWKYNKRTLARVDAYIANLHLPDTYIGLHVRQGDKLSEMSLYAPQLYMEKALEFSNCRDVFVLTDDYRAIDELKQNYPNHVFYTLCGKDEQGYDYDKLQAQTLDSKIEANVRLWTSMEVLEKSQIFVGTYSANPGMNMGFRMEQDRIHCLDFDEWKMW